MLRILRDMTEPELAELMNAMACKIALVAMTEKVELPRFVLLLFNDPHVAQYISNCNREDTIKALREAADRLERRQDVTRGGNKL